MRFHTGTLNGGVPRYRPLASSLNGIGLMMRLLVVALLLLAKTTAMDPNDWANYRRLADNIDDEVSSTAASWLGGGANAGPAGRAALGEGSSRPVSTGVRNDMAWPSSSGPSHAGRPASTRYRHRNTGGSEYLYYDAQNNHLIPSGAAPTHASFEEGTSGAVGSIRLRTAAQSQLLRGGSGLYSDTRAQLSAHPPSSQLISHAQRHYDILRNWYTQETGPFPRSLEGYYDKLRSTNERLFGRIDRRASPNGYISYRHSDVFVTPERASAVAEFRLPSSTFEERRVVEALLLERLRIRTDWRTTLNGPIFVLSARQLFPSDRGEEEQRSVLFLWDHGVVGQPPWASLHDFDLNDYRIEIGPRLDYPGSPYAALPLYPCRARHRTRFRDRPIEVGFINYPLSEDVVRLLVSPQVAHFHNSGGRRQPSMRTLPRAPARRQRLGP